MADIPSTQNDIPIQTPAPAESPTQKPTFTPAKAKSLSGALRNAKAGRPRGAKDSPGTDRQVQARKVSIRKENLERDKELLERAKEDPTLQTWIDITPESIQPVYDLLHSTIRSFSGLPGLAQDPSIKLEWSKACANCCNYYKLNPLSHPLVHLGIASFIAASPTIVCLKTMKQLEKTLELEGKDSPKAKALIADLARQGVILDPANSSPKTQEAPVNA